jgi:hypothetical protein
LYGARAVGQSERPWLERARRIRPRPRSLGGLAWPRWPDQRRAEGAYFIGERLRRLGDPRSRSYLRQALRQAPWLVKGWVRLLQAAVALP